MEFLFCQLEAYLSELELCPFYNAPEGKGGLIGEGERESFGGPVVGVG